MQHPLVSAAVLCYNQAGFVVECLEGIKAQNYPNLELIINDDASKDNSVAVIHDWLAKNSIPHHFLKNKTNQGICRSVNNILRQARGKYISGIAADDVWLPGKLLRQVELMERLPAKVGVVYSDALQMDEQGNLLPLRFLDADGRRPSSGVIPEGNIQMALWQGNNFIAPMTALIRRECFDRVGLYDETLFAEDWDMWLRISRCYDFVYSDEVSAKYRIVGTSATRSNFGRLLDDMCRTCLKHLESGQLELELRRAAAMRLDALASSSFMRKSPRHKQNLLQAAKYRPSAGGVARCLLAWSGFGPANYLRVRSLFPKRTLG
jgi:glycosyltransferase involved in cell wall biosynthesis